MQQFDPLVRLEKFMKKKKMITDAEIKAIEEQSKQQVEKAVEAYENIEPAPLEDIFNYTYAELTEPLKEQRDYLLALYVGEERKKNPIIEKIEGGFP